MEDLTKQYFDALMQMTERAKQAEEERDAALKAVADVDRTGDVYCNDGENWFARHAAVIDASRKMVEGENGL